MKKQLLPISLLLLLTSYLQTTLKAQSLIYDNGPIFNSVGTGAGGANESVLYTTTFSMGTIGFGHQANAFNRVADDFTISDCYWRIDSIVFFGYQTGSTTTSTFTAVNFRLWDSIPDAVGSNVVFGDTVTNRLISSTWSGTYRITETTTGNAQRPIMRNVCIVNSLILPAGTYWLDWQSAGALGSGPWAPPRTPVGLSVTGNGRQRTGPVWANLVDGGTGTPAQGLPFEIYGHVFTIGALAGNDADICSGTTIQLGENPAHSDGTGPVTYAWSNSTNMNDSSLANPDLLVLDTATYILTVTDSIGCIASDTVTINSLPEAIANITPLGSLTFCDGDSVQVDADIFPLQTYVWSNGATSTSIFATTAGLLTLNVTNSFGCFDSDTINVTVNPMPVTTVTQAGPSLTSDQAGASYQWLDCDNSFATLPGETGINYTATANGNYAVEVNLGGCIDTSTCYTVFGFSIEDELTPKILVYPNPATDYINVQIPSSSDAEYEMNIYDAVGKNVISTLICYQNSAPVNVSVLTAGTYIINFVGKSSGNTYQNVFVKN